MKIKEVKKIRENAGYTHIVVFGINNNGDQVVATHGDTCVHAREAANLGNNLKTQLGWPKKQCATEPLERKCENCSYWQRKKIDSGDRIPENWSGKCMINPSPELRYAQDRACSQMEPNG